MAPGGIVHRPSLDTASRVEYRYARFTYSLEALMLRCLLLPAVRTTISPLPILALAVLILTAGAAPVFAQAGAEPPASWGALVSFTPTWKASSTFQEIFLAEGEGTVEGSDFTIGLARGRTLGGHWSIAYTRKTIKNGTTIAFEESGSENNSSFSYSETLVFNDVYYDGIEAFVFIPFATIKNRVQIGLNVGGGAGFPKGTIERTQVNSFTFTPPTGPPQTQTDTDIETGPAKDYIFAIQPLGRVEILGAVILAPGLKVFFGGGLNLPSTAAFSVGAVYLIGAK
jgi:hypothetical protein